MSICKVGMKILVPVDGSEHSELALKTAAHMAKQFQGKITLIHVVPTPTISAIERGYGVVEYPVIVEETLEKIGTGILADGEKKVKAEGVQVETSLKRGHVVDQILKASREGKFDLIVIGARGVSRIKEILLGSVSDGVTRYARNPVLVVK